MAKQSESNKKIDFEKAEERLEEIVDKLGSDDVSLDESLKLFEEGVSLVKECNKILEKAERKIKIIENGKEDSEND